MFCGAGGLDLGFEQAGYNIAVAIDYCEQSVGTHNLNLKSTTAITADIEELGARGVAEIIYEAVPKGTKIGIIGGPPCQGFSTANVNSNAADPRNNLAKIYMEIVGQLCKTYIVEFVLMENVTGLRSDKHRSTFNELQNNLKNHGFDTYVSELNSAQFGVPQKRKRIFFVGISSRHSSVFTFPTSKAKQRTVRDAIDQFPEPVFFKRGLKPEDIPFHPNHWTMQPKSSKFKEKKFNNRASRCFRIVEWDKPSNTIAFGNREIFVHPNGNRRLSIYESMLLQGFPKYFQIMGTLSSQVTQVSNAVPPPVAKALASRIKTYLT